MKGSSGGAGGSQGGGGRGQPDPHPNLESYPEANRDPSE